MIIVIVGTSRKNENAGHMKTKDGRRIVFVADPENAQKQNALKLNSIVYRHPDDKARAGKSWKEMLLEYNNRCIHDPSSNTLELLPARQLYKHRRYEELVSAFGSQNTFILSEGWGLISADFLTPNYDITFSRSAASNLWALRRNKDCDTDLMMLPKETDKPVVFLGGKEYIPFFCHLTKDVESKRIIFYNSKDRLSATGCTLSRFDTAALTNWYHVCARELCEIKEELTESKNP